MFFLLSFVICHGLLSYIGRTSARQCDPANYICSGRCPKVPPDVELPYGVAICMKDSQTQACVCWLKSDTSHSGTLFICEALINGSINQFHCHTPPQCFPPNSEPTCLVVPRCNCLLMNDESPSALEFGLWKPVKAIIKINQASAKFPTHVQEFSLKHLLFLLGFVIAPLLCWCLLNFVTEKKWKCKRMSCPETQPMNTDRGTMTAITLSSDNDVLLNCPSNTQASSHQQSDQFDLENLDSVQSSSQLIQKDENPPSYEEAMRNSFSQEAESTPPPTYNDCIYARNPNQHAWLPVINHSRPIESE